MEEEHLQIPQMQVLKQRQFALTEFSSRLSSAQRSKIQRELSAITVSLQRYVNAGRKEQVLGLKAGKVERTSPTAFRISNGSSPQIAEVAAPRGSTELKKSQEYLSKITPIRDNATYAPQYSAAQFSGATSPSNGSPMLPAMISVVEIDEVYQSRAARLMLENKMVPSPRST